MFNGLIREIGKVINFEKNILSIESKLSPNLGDSIAVNGICLTVIKILNNGFQVELSPETLSKVAIENFKNSVHLEPAMQMGDRFEGHIVQGHIDIIGKLTKIEKNQNSYNWFIEVDNNSLMMPKGSITIDGVSLTINSIFNNGIRLTIIPYTMENTNFKNYKIGRRLNIESDMFARYIENILFNRENQKKLTWEDIDLIAMSY